MQVDALAKLYMPGLHDEQLCAPDEPLYSPARHGVQLDALPKLYLPGLHDEQFCAPDEPL